MLFPIFATVADIKTVVKEIKPIENDMNIHTALSAMMIYFQNNGKYAHTVNATVKEEKDGKDGKDGNDGKDGKDGNTTTTTTHKTAVEVLLTFGEKAFDNIDV